VLCLSPTKALINDQHRRLLSPAARIRVPVFKWHGEAPRSGKNALIQQQRGIVFMTPESLEGSFIRRANLVTALFSSLDAILIDELHDFLSGPRGHQLAALLARLDEVAKARPRRVALSGTVGDLKGAKHWLSPSNPSSVRIVEERSGGQELRSRIRGYSAPLPKALPEGKGYVSRRMPTAFAPA
jgi:ATP-dependent Lhr-like helicase